MGSVSSFLESVKKAIFGLRIHPAYSLYNEKSLLFIFLLSISSSRAVSEKNTQQKELKAEKLSIGKASKKTLKMIGGGISFILVLATLFLYKRRHDTENLFKACLANEVNEVERLIKSRWAFVDVNTRDQYDRTLLHRILYIDYYGPLDMVNMLLSISTIDIYIKYKGKTPIEFAKTKLERLNEKDKKKVAQLEEILLAVRKKQNPL